MERQQRLSEFGREKTIGVVIDEVWEMIHKSGNTVSSMAAEIYVAVRAPARFTPASVTLGEA